MNAGNLGSTFDGGAGITLAGGGVLSFAGGGILTFAGGGVLTLNGDSGVTTWGLATTGLCNSGGSTTGGTGIGADSFIVAEREVYSRSLIFFNSSSRPALIAAQISLCCLDNRFASTFSSNPEAMRSS